MINRLKYWVLMLVIILSGNLFGQDCARNLEQAKRLYYDGNFEKVITLLTDCHDIGLSDNEQKEALELLINANLVINNNKVADQYMEDLLSLMPLYTIRSTDLIEFQELYNSYRIRTKFNVGLVAGVNVPKFHIMQYRSLASITEETTSYNGNIGPSLGIKGEWMVWKKLFLSGTLLYQQFSYSQSETIMTFQDVFIAEKMNYISVPLQIGYEFLNSDFKFFINAGVSPHFLVSSKADLELFGIEPDYLSTLTGIPRKVQGYNISDQRKNVTLNYTFGAGIRKSFGLYAAEFAVHYEFGLNNLVNEDNRYTDTNLYRTYSYIPDDFKMDNLRITLGVVKSFVVPEKIKN